MEKQLGRVLTQDPQRPRVAVSLRRGDLSPLALAQSLVDKDRVLGARADDDRAVLAAIRGPDDVGRGSRDCAAGDNEAVVRRRVEVLGVGGDAVVDGEGVGGGIEEGSVLVDVDVLAVGELFTLV